MKLKAQKIKDGLHPSEVVVSVSTTSGDERLVVPKRSLYEDSALEIGYPISNEPGRYLVELPQETTSGAWRVWVNKDTVF